MKKIKLVPKAVLTNSMDIDVMDFPGEDTTKPPRKRCQITVEYGTPEIRELQKQDLDIDGSINHYRDYIYNMVRVLIADEWEAVSGFEEVLSIVEEKIGARL